MSGVTVVYKDPVNWTQYQRMEGKEVIINKRDQKLILIGFRNEILKEFDLDDVVRIEEA